MQFLRTMFSARLLRSGFIRQVTTLAGGSAVAQAVGIAATPILTRLYTPEDLGHFGLYTSFVAVAAVVLTLSYELAVVSADDEREAAYLVLGALLVSLPLSLIFTGLLLLLIHQGWLGFDSLPPAVIGLTLLGLLLTPLFSTLRYWLIRWEAFATLSRVTVVNSLSRLAVQIPLGLLRGAWAGLIWGDLVGRVLSDGLMLRRSYGALRAVLRPLRWPELAAVLGKYRKYPTVNVPSAFVNTLAASIPVPLIIDSYGAEAGGYFNLARLILALPLRLIGNSVADVFHKRMAEYARTEPTRCLAFFLRVGGVLLLASALPGLLLALTAPSVAALVLGPDWITAGHIAVTMVPLLIAQMVVIPLSRVVFVFDRPELRVVYDVLGLVTPVLAIHYSIAQGYTLLGAVLVMNLLNTATYVFLFLVLLRAMQRMHGLAKQQGRVNN